MSCSHTDQPFEGTLPERGLVGIFIAKFLAVLSTRDVRKIPEEIVVVMAVYHLPDACHIVHTPARVLKMMKKSDLSILCWLFSRFN